MEELKSRIVINLKNGKRLIGRIMYESDCARELEELISRKKNGGDLILYLDSGGVVSQSIEEVSSIEIQPMGNWEVISK